jgi:hypothetical protein
MRSPITGREVIGCCKFGALRPSPYLPDLCDACRNQLEGFRSWLRQFDGVYVVLQEGT